MPERLRLQKFLSNAGAASRRRAEAMIRAGRVSLNGVVVTTLGTTLDPRRDRVELDGRPVAPARAGAQRYVLLHKPRAVMSTTRDDRGRQTVLDLLPAEERAGLTLVGRLDYHSEGLVLLTDDGALVHRLTHPSSGTPKTYEAKVKGVPTEAALERLRRGVRLEDGLTQPAAIEVVGRASSNTWVEITITEGRNRQVRRMFRHIGHPVQRLVRVAIGAVALGDLPPGAHRELNAAEIALLQEL